MDRDRTRVLALGGATLGLLVTTLFVLDWFTFRAFGLTSIGIDLQSVHGCAGDGCQSFSLARMTGLFPLLCKVTFFTSIAFALVVAYQTFARVMSGAASEQLVRVGYFLGLAVFILTGVTAYLFHPQFPSAAGGFGFELSIDRTWAPALSFLASLAGMITMFYAIQHDSDSGAEYKQIVAFPNAQARIAHRTRDNARLDGGSGSVITEPAVTPPPASEPGRPRLQSTPIPQVQADRPSAPISLIPDLVRGKLSFAVVTAEVTRAGIDARLEDNSTILVLWRDVVGVVVRRLPTAYDSFAFVDIVSTAGSTLRILPWSRLSGDPVATAEVDPESDARPRAIVARVLACAPEAAVDPATRAFCEGSEHERPAQLPDLGTLAAHDARLA